MLKSATTTAPFRRAAAAPGLVASGLLILAAVVLGLEPLVWLVGTWTDPAYASNGAMIFFVAAGLAGWSLTSPLAAQADGRSRAGLVLLCCSAGLRLLGQVLAINSIGALCLVLDVLAGGLLLRLDQRRRPVSPVWLAVVFAFSLPLERIVQRTIGYPLQHVSADGACVALRSLFDNVQCMGVRLVVDGRDVLVDLPCSGARTLLLSLLTFAVLAALGRPGLMRTVAGFAVVLLAAFAANVVRISILSIGIAQPDLYGGIDVMAAPWHDAIGLAALLLSLLPVIFVLRCGLLPNDGGQYLDDCRAHPGNPDCIRQDGWRLAGQKLADCAGPSASRPSLLFAGVLAVAAVIIVVQPQRPLDVARREAALVLPAWISGQAAHDIPLLEREKAYFTRFGGASAKASYGPHGLLVVRTTSPLRHLHAPDECLRGLGFSVRYLGLAQSLVPTAVYVAEAADGATYRVDVTFVSDRGDAVAHVASAVWLWLNGRAKAWRAIQRISPIGIDQDRHNQWSSAALTALGVEMPRQPDPAGQLLRISQTEGVGR
jgi:exosortase/archaeosortase family protein